MWWFPPGSVGIQPKTAKDYGYKTCPDLEAGDGYEFVQVGDKVKADDEYYSSGTGPWFPINYSPASSTEIGRKVIDIHFPLRRKIGSAPSKDKWSCRHKRDPKDKQCPVCSAMYGRIVNT